MTIIYIMPIPNINNSQHTCTHYNYLKVGTNDHFTQALGAWPYVVRYSRLSVKSRGDN